MNASFQPVRKPNAGQQEDRSPSYKAGVLRRLLGYVRPYWRYLVLAVLVTGLSTGVGLAPPYLTKLLVDGALRPGGSGRLLLGLIGGLLVAEVGRLLLSMGRSRLYAWLGGRLTLDVRTGLFQHLQRLTLRFYDRQQVGALMARITQDAGSLQGFLTNTLPNVFTHVLTFVGVFAVTFRLDPRLTLLALAPAVLLTLGSAFFWQRLRPLHREVWERWGRLNSLLNNALSGIRIVKAFAQEKRQQQAFCQESEALFRAHMNVQWLTSAFMPLMGLAGTLATLLVWGLGGRDIQGGHLTLGTLMAFLGYLGKLQGPVHFFANLPSTYTSALVGAQRIFEILDTAPEPYEDPQALPVSRVRGEIEMEGVTFGYDPHTPVLHDIDLHIRPGELVGIVGHTGAGKSSLISLIGRFYDPDQGSIRLDGRDLRKLRLEDLRWQIGLVPQDPFLFDDSLVANIAYGRPGAGSRVILEAAWRAHAHDFTLRLSDGYDTRVGERGVRLSGGERQRISLARALLHDPGILILDEATSSVDVETEQQIQEGMAALVRGRTTLAIAHRFSTLQQADRLVVLEQGRKVEEGTHEELMARRGVYYQLVKLQGMDRERERGVREEESRRSGLPWLAGDMMRLERCAGERLDLALADGRVYGEVEALRAFPLSDPERFIGFVDREGEAVGVLADMGELEAISRGILTKALARRYACPSIVRIDQVREDGGNRVCWQVDTDQGRRELVIEHPRENIAEIEPDRLRVVDREGNRFALHPSALDRRSRRKLRESGTASHAVLGFGFHHP